MRWPITISRVWLICVVRAHKPKKLSFLSHPQSRGASFEDYNHTQSFWDSGFTTSVDPLRQTSSAPQYHYWSSSPRTALQKSRATKVGRGTWDEHEPQALHNNISLRTTSLLVSRSHRQQCPQVDRRRIIIIATPQPDKTDLNGSWMGGSSAELYEWNKMDRVDRCIECCSFICTHLRWLLMIWKKNPPRSWYAVLKT